MSRLSFPGDCRRADSNSARFWTAVAVISLGQALRISLGNYHPAPLILVGLSLCALILAVARTPTDISGDAITTMLGLGLGAELLWLTIKHPAIALEVTDDELRIYFWIVRALLATAAAIWIIPRLRHLAFPTLVLTHAYVSWWVISHSNPPIDVLLFQKEAAAALLQGKNPYGMTFADPYQGNWKFYGDGLTASGKLLFGYPYLPLSLLLVIPAHLAGDVRYAHATAVVIAAVMMHKMASDTAGRLAAALFLFTPWVFQLEQFAWTEGLLVTFLAATAYVMKNGSAATVWTLGAFLATKQYAVLLLGAIVPSSIAPRKVIGSVALAVAMTLPFLVWHPSAFLDSAIWLQFRQPWREDALSFAVLLANAGLPRMPWLGFLAGFLALIWVVTRRERNPDAMARNAALIFLAFFAFSKQAFYNYYFLVVGAMCCSLAAGNSGYAMDTVRRDM